MAIRDHLPKVPIHSLRHTHAVLLLGSGSDIKMYRNV
jgi:integrase